METRKDKKQYDLNESKLWTLPRAERNKVQKRIYELQTIITQTTDNIDFAKNQINSAEYMLNQYKHELDTLEKNLS